MNRKLVSVISLSLMIINQSLYAKDITITQESRISKNQELTIDDIQEFDIIKNIKNTENKDDLNKDDLDVNQGNINKPNQIILELGSKTVLVAGVQKILLTPPTTINNVTLVPIRFVVEEVLGAKVEWKQETQAVKIIKDNTTVSLTIGSKIASINGVEQPLFTAPINSNQTTLVPLRFLSEVFGMDVEFNSDTKQIIIKKSGPEGVESESETISNKAPIAEFYFPETYAAGQVVTVVNNSYDPDGDEIIDQLWSVTDTKEVTNSQLNKIFKTPKAGTYKIGLKVQDIKGTWSEWTYQTITILPNRAPIITSLTPVKSSFAQGEEISFLPYTYENEAWEAVKEGKWTYRKVDEPLNKATLGKPKAIFAEGDYIISLCLDDEYGNRSQAFESMIHISNEIVDTELNYKFTKGLIGEWIDNFPAFNYLNYKQVDILEKSYELGTLIMSDSPEEVKGTGILYKDSIDGKGRLLIHHINLSQTTDKERFVLVAYNPTDKPIKINLLNKSIKGPATDILRVGQLCLAEYLSGKVPTESFILQPGEKKYIYDKAWIYNMCISAHIDVETDGPVTFIVGNMKSTDDISNIDNLYHYLPDGVHYSGTYDKTGIHYKLNLTGKEPERLSIGIADSDEWLIGYNATTMEQVKNIGNFGVSYYITVTAEEDMGVILNNRGGIFQGAVKWNDTVYNMPGKGVFSGTTTKAVVLGTIKKGETVKIEYLLPNGSAAPTLIGFIPKDKWK